MWYWKPRCFLQTIFTEDYMFLLHWVIPVQFIARQGKGLFCQSLLLREAQCRATSIGCNSRILIVDIWTILDTDKMKNQYVCINPVFPTCPANTDTEHRRIILHYILHAQNLALILFNKKSGFCTRNSSDILT